MKAILLVLSFLVIVGGTLPYIIDVIKKRTKPKVVSWFTWSLLTGIATAAALTAHQYASAVVTAAATVSTLSVVLAGLRYGNRQFDALDITCQIAAIVGLILWLIFNSPVTAIVATVCIDFVAGLPTWKHIWQKPHEETAIAFSTGSIGGILSVLGSDHARSLGLIYPIYLTIANAILYIMIITGPSRRPI